MIERNPRAMLWIGFALVLLGAVLAWLMFLRVIEPSFLLSFVSYGASIGGTFLGLIATAFYIKINRDKHRK